MCLSPTNHDAVLQPRAGTRDRIASEGTVVGSQGILCSQNMYEIVLGPELPPITLYLYQLLMTKRTVSNIRTAKIIRADLCPHLASWYEGTASTLV